ncbi:hypothetical protein [Bradyrhizobium sp. LA6.12]|uniref:hypothetical protein n=1 Tax=unclassified Bradyrhizobium TaxID=2631580 RepID=UPI00339608AD
MNWKSVGELSVDSAVEIKTIKKRFNPRGHGGARPGAGRKPKNSVGQLNCAECGDPRAAALAVAVKRAKPLQFVLAMVALNAPLDLARRTLGMSPSQFIELYGSIRANVDTDACGNVSERIA